MELPRCNVHNYTFTKSYLCSLRKVEIYRKHYCNSCNTFNSCNIYDTCKFWKLCRSNILLVSFIGISHIFIECYTELYLIYPVSRKISHLLHCWIGHLTFPIRDSSSLPELILHSWQTGAQRNLKGASLSPFNDFFQAHTSRNILVLKWNILFHQELHCTMVKL